MSSNPVMKADPFKEWSDNSGLYYYGYRFYDPSLQRWPNQDPLDEFGFEVLHTHHAAIEVPIVSVIPGLPEMPDLYEFVGNDPVIRSDAFGLIATPCQAAQAALDAALEDADEEMYLGGGKISQGTLNAINSAKAAVNANCPDKPLPPQKCPDAPQQPVKVVALVGESPTRRIGRFTTERSGACRPARRRGE